MLYNLTRLLFGEKSIISLKDLRFAQPPNKLLLTHWTKLLIGTTSNLIGIKLWFAPQISEHCPYIIPGRLIENISWLSRPGTASAFTPKVGTVHEWITSVADVMTRICEFKGNTTLLSVSSKRFIFKDKSFCGNIYESNSKSGKSEYSYDQYHWWPMALIVKLGEKGSSSIYNTLSEGVAIDNKIKTGTTVQIISIVWFCNKYLLLIL